MITDLGPQLGTTGTAVPIDTIDIAVSTADATDDSPYDITITYGETKQLTFTVTDGTDAIDCASATLSMTINNIRRGDLNTITTASFDTTNASSGILLYTLDTTDFLRGTYLVNLSIDFDGSVEASNNIYLRIT